MAISKKQFWQKHVDRADQLKSSIPQYCKEHNLSYSAFLYWRRKLRSPGSRKQSFVPVQVSPPVQSAPTRSIITITLPDGTTLRWES